MTPQQEIISALLEKYPRHGKLTLARIAYKNHPECFVNLNSARCAFRRMTRASGEQNRKRVKTIIDRPLGKAGTVTFGRIPPQRNPFKEPWKAYQIEGPAKVLLLQDIHIPFHETDPLRITVDFGKKINPDIILLNGDVIDCHAVSFWMKDPRKRDFKEEIKSTQEFLLYLRTRFPKAQIIYKWGNHEERWESYMYAKAPELLGVADFELRNLLRFDEHRIGILKKDPETGEDHYQEISDKRPIRVGHLNIVHGHEYKFSIKNPVNAARGLFLRAKSYAICGHFHQSSSHNENNIDLHSIATWSVGCLCQLHQDYAPLNDWQHGFAWIEADKEGHFEVNNKVIKNGKIL